MTSAPSLDWEQCTVEGCEGSRSHENGKCLAHLGPAELGTTLERIAREEHLDARGVEISSELLGQILAALPRTPEGSPRFGEAEFRAATFTGDAVFDGSVFAGDASFLRATFQGEAEFVGTTFEAYAWFPNASFQGSATFREATFDGPAWFEEVTFDGPAWFQEATFEGDAWFAGATFNGQGQFPEVPFRGDATFSGATFEASAEFRETTFLADARFDQTTFRKVAYPSFTRATFGGRVDLEGATFEGDAGFREATFERARSFGPLVVLDSLALEEASFLQTAEIAVSARRLFLVGTSFPAGVGIRVRWADVVLDEAVFGAPSILSGAPPFDRLDEESLVQALAGNGEKTWEAVDEDRLRLEQGGRPRVASVRRANVGTLVLSDADLRGCRFVKAHNLDGLWLEGDVEFAHQPDLWWWARRRVLAEEHQWRHTHGSLRAQEGWYGVHVRPPARFLRGDPEVENALDASSIAGIYRDLRKGREDSKDEPGAADFYYGEMEMRRFDTTKPRAERLIIWLYWLVSGYGLRASRALLALAVTVLVFAVLLYAWGFPSQRSFLDALTFSAESTTSLFRPPERELTLAGEWLQIGLRLLGPLFFGLALLSLRGRVKR